MLTNDYRPMFMLLICQYSAMTKLIDQPTYTILQSYSRVLTAIHRLGRMIGPGKYTTYRPFGPLTNLGRRRRSNDMYTSAVSTFIVSISTVESTIDDEPIRQCTHASTTQLSITKARAAHTYISCQLLSLVPILQYILLYHINIDPSTLYTILTVIYTIHDGTSINVHRPYFHACIPYSRTVYTMTKVNGSNGMYTIICTVHSRVYT